MMKMFLGVLLLLAVQVTVSGQVSNSQSVTGIPDRVQDMLPLTFEKMDYEGKKGFILSCVPEFEKILQAIEARSKDDAKDFVEEIAPEIGKYLKAGSELNQSTKTLEHSQREFQEVIAEQKKLQADAQEIIAKTVRTKNLLVNSLNILTLWLLAICLGIILSGFFAFSALALRIAPSWAIFRMLRKANMKLAGLKAANQEKWTHLQEILGLAMGHLKHASLYLDEVSVNANSGRLLKSICKATHVLLGSLGKFGLKAVDPESSVLSKAGQAISKSREALSQAEKTLAEREKALEETIKQLVATLRADDVNTETNLKVREQELQKLKQDLEARESDLRQRELQLASDRLEAEKLLTEASGLEQTGRNMLHSVAGLSQCEEAAA